MGKAAFWKIHIHFSHMLHQLLVSPESTENAQKISEIRLHNIIPLFPTSPV